MLSSNLNLCTRCRLNSSSVQLIKDAYLDEPEEFNIISKELFDCSRMTTDKLINCNPLQLSIGERWQTTKIIYEERHQQIMLEGTLQW